MDSEQRENVFILSIDSLRYDYFEDVTTELAKQLGAVNFREAIAPASNTVCSAPVFHAGVFADSALVEGSRNPLPGAPSKQIQFPGDDSIPTVARQFTNEGYETSLWTPNPMFASERNFDQGFQHGTRGAKQGNKLVADFLRDFETAYNFAQRVYFDAVKPFRERLSNSEQYVWRPAEDIQQNALNWLGETKGGVLCWLHYMDTHHPFEPPNEYLDTTEFSQGWTRNEIGEFSREAIREDAEGLSEADIADIKVAYRASCRYLGDQILEFVTELIEREHFDPDRDVLCLTSDHGEAFSPEKHGMFGHASFFEEIVRVPLVISRPDWDSGTVDKQVSLIDLMPTLMDTVDIPVPETFEGRVCDTPEDMQREYAYFIDRRQVRRGIRGEGKKLFGHRLATDEFEIVLTEVESETIVEETILHRDTVPEAKKPDGDTEKRVWNMLLEKLESNRGGVFEEELLTSLKNETQSKHSSG